MKGNTWGYVVMTISIAFGIFYFTSMFLWFKYEILSRYSRFWWTWWIIALPLSLIVGFAVFFVTWIGWVMIKSKPKTVQQLIEESRKRSKEAKTPSQSS